MGFSLEGDLEKMLDEVRKIAYENQMSRGFDITLKVRVDENPTIDFTILDRIVKTWED
jgi:hypothetical protein